MTTDLLSRIEKATRCRQNQHRRKSRRLLSQTAAEITSITQARTEVLNPAAPTTDENLETIAKLTIIKSKLTASVSRLQIKLDEATARERYEAWKERYDVLEVARDRLAEELKSTYPDLVHKLTDLLSRVVVNDQQIDALHNDAPSGVPARLKTAEMKARGIDGFTGAVPSITKELQLPAWSAEQRLAYPQKHRDVSMFAPVQLGDRYSGDWAAAAEKDNARRRQLAAKRLAEQAEQDRFRSASLRDTQNRMTQFRRGDYDWIG